MAHRLFWEVSRVCFVSGDRSLVSGAPQISQINLRLPPTTQCHTPLITQSEVGRMAKCSFQGHNGRFLSADAALSLSRRNHQLSANLQLTVKQLLPPRVKRKRAAAADIETKMLGQIRMHDSNSECCMTGLMRASFPRQRLASLHSD